MANGALNFKWAPITQFLEFGNAYAATERSGGSSKGFLRRIYIAEDGDKGKPHKIKVIYYPTFF